MNRPLVVTPGMGIGPEVTARALAAHPPGRPVVLVGRPPPGMDLVQMPEVRPPPPGRIGLVVPATTPLEVEAIRLAAEACLAGRAAAMVTGPIHKGRLAARGWRFRGHTDYLGHLCGARPVMAFVGGRLRVALVTTHIPLAQVPAAITREAIQHTVRVAAEALQRDLGIETPRMAVCGLNPHAGEGGLLGTEEREVIGPSVEELRAGGLDVRGPLSAETAFLEARAGRVDLVIAMYHDQGLAPLKALDFGRSVNWTLGLPIVRTSVDHGTADELVGTGRADSGSMQAALALAEQIAERRHAKPPGGRAKP